MFDQFHLPAGRAPSAQYLNLPPPHLPTHLHTLPPPPQPHSYICDTTPHRQHTHAHAQPRRCIWPRHAVPLATGYALSPVGQRCNTDQPRRPHPSPPAWLSPSHSAAIADVILAPCPRTCPRLSPAPARTCSRLSPRPPATHLAPPQITLIAPTSLPRLLQNNNPEPLHLTPTYLKQHAPEPLHLTPT